MGASGFRFSRDARRTSFSAFRADRRLCRAQEPYAADRECTWKFTIAGHQRTIPLPQQVALVNTFSYMPFLGDINLRSPDLEIGVFEEYTWDPLRGAKVREARQAMGAEPSRKGKEKALEEGDPEDTGGLRMVWMGRKVRLARRLASFPRPHTLTFATCRSATRPAT